MAQLKVMAQGIEISGDSIDSYLSGMGIFKDMVLRIMSKHNLDEIAPGKWYTQQAWFNALEDISKEVGDNVLYSIGAGIAGKIVLPDEVNSIVSVLNYIDIFYHMSHRLDGMIMYDAKHGMISEGIGHYTSELIAINEAAVTCSNPNHCDFDRGFIETIVKMQAGEGIKIYVKHNDSLPCRKSGAESCTFIISW